MAGGGEAWACGRNTYGQLGLNDKVLPRYLSIAKITQPFSTGWDVIEAGRDHAVALRNNVVYAAGRNALGQQGDGGVVVSNSKFTAVSGNYTSISSGKQFWAALSGTKLYVVGNNNYGQLGLNISSDFVDTLQPVPGDWNKVICGNQSIYVLSGTALYSAGYNAFGELGLGDDADRNVLTKVPGSFADIVHAGATNVIARDISGNLVVCGSNMYGPFGDGNRTPREGLYKTKTFVPINYNFSKIVFGDYHAIALSAVPDFFLTPSPTPTQGTLDTPTPTPTQTVTPTVTPNLVKIATIDSLRVPPYSPYADFFIYFNITSYEQYLEFGPLVQNDDVYIIGESIYFNPAKYAGAAATLTSFDCHGSDITELYLSSMPLTALVWLDASRNNLSSLRLLNLSSLTSVSVDHNSLRQTNINTLFNDLCAMAVLGDIRNGVFEYYLNTGGRSPASNAAFYELTARNWDINPFDPNGSGITVRTTVTPTQTFTSTPTPSMTPTPTITPTITVTHTPTVTPSVSPTPTSFEIPGAPTIVAFNQAEEGNYRFGCVFIPPANVTNGNAGPTEQIGYYINCSLNGSNFNTISGTPIDVGYTDGDDVPFTLTGISLTGRLYIKINCYNSRGSGPYSNLMSYPLS